MELGLHVPDFTWPDGPGALARDLTRVATAAEEAGFAKLSVMDHVWQIGHLGPPEHEMLEAIRRWATWPRGHPGSACWRG